MIPWPALTPTLLAALVALGSAGLLLAPARRRDPSAPVAGTAIGLVVLALAVAFPQGVVRAPLVAGVGVALLAHDRRDTQHGECALKLLWLLGPALALSWLGDALLVAATGSARIEEQWGVLAIGLEPRFLWSIALPLSLLAGVVFLGVAPFHFWLADLLQGGRVWLAPLTAAALQVAGAQAVVQRLEGIETFPSGGDVTGAMLRIAAMVAFAIGAAALPFQRRPERRVATLASLQAAVLLAALAAAHGRGSFAVESASFLGRWSAHLVVALTGASLFARFIPVHEDAPAAAAPLFRRHRLSALAGSFTLFSLAGLPGTPGGWLCLDAARALVLSRHTAVLAVMGIAWAVSFWTVVQMTREGFGVPTAAPAPPAAPLQGRIVLALGAVTLGVVALGWWVG